MTAHMAMEHKIAHFSKHCNLCKSENLQGRSQHNQASLCKSDIVVEISYMPFSFSHKGAPCKEDTSLFTIRINDVETTGLERTGHLIQALQSGITTKQAF